MRVTSKVLLPLLIAILGLSGTLHLAHAQSSYQPVHATNWQYGAAAVPATLTQIQAGTTQVYWVTVVNTGSSAVTLTVQDGSTCCAVGGAAGKPFTPISQQSIAPGQYVNFPLSGARFTGGVFWVASAANALSGWVQGAY